MDLTDDFVLAYGGFGSTDPIKLNDNYSLI